MKFYNREEEKRELKGIIKDSKNGFCFKVYLWLRRVWKTTLVINTVKESKVNFLYLLIYWNNTEQIEVKNIKLKIHESLNIDIKWDSLKELFFNIFEYSEKHNIIVILDEFQNFEYINNSIFWDLVEVIDSYKIWLNESIPKLCLIALGSYVSLMEKIFIKNLYVETKQTLDIELRWNKYKHSILKAIANGLTSKKDILIYVYNIRSKDSWYRNKYNELEKDLNSLIDLWIVHKKIKVPHNNSFKWTYHIRNIYFKNFLRYVLPYESFIEEWNYDYIIDNFYLNFRKWLWFTYEDIVKEFLMSWNYPLKFSQLWKWWKWSTEEIDIVGVNEMDNFIFWVECKYTKDKKWVKELEKLQRRVELIDWNKKNSKTNYLYLAVSHSWFTKEAIEYAKINKIDLLDTDDLIF